MVSVGKGPPLCMLETKYCCTGNPAVTWLPRNVYIFLQKENLIYNEYFTKNCCVTWNIHEYANLVSNLLAY